MDPAGRNLECFRGIGSLDHSFCRSNHYDGRVRRHDRIPLGLLTFSDV